MGRPGRPCGRPRGILGHPRSSLGCPWSSGREPGGLWGVPGVLGVSLGAPRGSGDPGPDPRGARRGPGGGLGGPGTGPRVPVGIKGGNKQGRRTKLISHALGQRPGEFILAPWSAQPYDNRHSCLPSPRYFQPRHVAYSHAITDASANQAQGTYTRAMLHTAVG